MQLCYMQRLPLVHVKSDQYSLSLRYEINKTGLATCSALKSSSHHHLQCVVSQSAGGGQVKIFTKALICTRSIIIIGFTETLLQLVRRLTFSHPRRFLNIGKYFVSIGKKYLNHDYFNSLPQFCHWPADKSILVGLYL